MPLRATERWIRFIVLNGTDRHPTLLLSLYTLIVASRQEESVDSDGMPRRSLAQRRSPDLRSQIAFYLTGGEDWPFGVSDVALQMPPTIRPSVTLQGQRGDEGPALHVRGTGMPLRPIDSSLP